MGHRICRILTSMILAATIVCCLSSCARNPNANPQDPRESYNRKVFAFNNAMDKAIFRPVAKTYAFITPNFIQNRITNVFSNVGEFTTITNDILQGKIGFMVMDMWRFVINTTVGIGGMFDPATRFGFAEHHEDFGLTLAVWGDSESAYSVAPVLGPSTFRDTFGLITDTVAVNFAAWNFINPLSLRYGLYGLYLVDKRAGYLDADALVDDAFDPYIFMRDAYLQQRKQQVLDNKKSVSEYYTEYYSDKLSDDFADDSAKGSAESSATDLSTVKPSDDVFADDPAEPSTNG